MIKDAAISGLTFRRNLPPILSLPRSATSMIQSAFFLIGQSDVGLSMAPRPPDGSMTFPSRHAETLALASRWLSMI